MTIALRADAGGNSGALQLNGVDRLILNADGTLSAAASPATGNRSVALATMQKFADEFGSSLVPSGYQRLPSGLIVQWSKLATSGSADVNWTFPIAFPNAVLCLSAVYGGAGGTSNTVFGSFGTGGLSSVPIGSYVCNTASRIAASIFCMAIGN